MSSKTDLFKKFYTLNQVIYLNTFSFINVINFYDFKLQIIGLILIYFVYYWIVQYRGGFSFTEPKIIFNWHPLLMTIAFLYLFANGKFQQNVILKYIELNV